MRRISLAGGWRVSGMSAGFTVAVLGVRVVAGRLRWQQWRIGQVRAGEPLLRLSLVITVLIACVAPLTLAAKRGTLFCFGGRRAETITLSGIARYTGRQSGTIRLIATRDIGTWTGGSTVTLDGPGSYSVTGVDREAACWVRAFRDTNGNQVCDPWEACGVFAFDPYTFPGSLQEVDIILNDPDTDGDALPDWWELAHWGSLAALPNDDPDGDGRPNLLEYREGTDPMRSNLNDGNNELGLVVYTPLD